MHILTIHAIIGGVRYARGTPAADIADLDAGTRSSLVSCGYLVATDTDPETAPPAAAAVPAPTVPEPLPEPTPDPEPAADPAPVGYLDVSIQTFAADNAVIPDDTNTLPDTVIRHLEAADLRTVGDLVAYRDTHGDYTPLRGIGDASSRRIATVLDHFIAFATQA